MEKIDMFSSPFYKTRIDPILYNKKDVVDTILKNYEKQPIRNKWDDSSDLHHYYNDWNNPDFERVDLSKLRILYNDIVNTCFSKFKFRQNFSYNINITNITANDGSQNMASHDHYLNDGENLILFSMVHYLKFTKEHVSTVFQNPLKVAAYGLTIEKPNRLFQPSLETMAYCMNWEIPTQEDDVIIFPSYVQHYVPKKTKATETRITVVANISVKV